MGNHMEDKVTCPVCKKEHTRKMYEERYLCLECLNNFTPREDTKKPYCPQPA